MRSINHRRRLILWVMSAILIALVPMVVLMIVTYSRAIGRAERSLKAHVNTAAVRSDALWQHIDVTLHRLKSDVKTLRAEQIEQFLARAVYRDYRFREVGILDRDAKLVFTSFGPVNPPLPVGAKDRPIPGNDNTQIVGLLRTHVMNDRSIMFALPTEELGSVNLLVEPALLTIYLDSIDIGPTGYLAIVMSRNRQVLGGVGDFPVVENELLAAPDGHAIYVERLAGNGQVLIVASVDAEWVLRSWAREMSYIAPTVFVCNLLLIGMTYRIARRRTGLEQEILTGLKNKEFFMVYQPIVELQTGRCLAVETLIRWNHPSQGLIPPAVFIPTAEQTGVIEQLTVFVVKTACAELKTWLEADPERYFTINLPPRMIVSGRASAFVDYVEKAGIPPAQIVYEVTEGQLLAGDQATIVAEMTRLAARGVRFALDDFGTGYSRLNYLHKYPFEYLKLDRSFMPKAEPNPSLSAVLESLIELGQKLNLQLVAEGVETPAQSMYLRTKNVLIGQGWLYSPAIPIKELRKLHNIPHPISTSSLQI